MTQNPKSSLKKYQNKIEATKTKFIQLKTVNQKKLSILDSKVGGFPYWPKSQSYPQLGGKPAKLFSQINFSDLKEQGLELENYPNKGILQFFCELGDDCWGIDFNDENQSNIKVIYHENIEDNYFNENDNAEINETANDYEGMAFESAFKITASYAEEFLGSADEVNHIKHNYDFISELNDEESDEFYGIGNSGSKIGGYAFFTQYDPRKLEQSKDSVLLLQLDSDDNMMFGDVGVVNWFIKKEDLINKDFSKVLFAFDCH